MNMKAHALGVARAPLRIWTRSVTTLHIEGSSVRLLAVTGRRVTKWAEEPLAAGLVRDGLVADAKTVGERIKSLLAAHRIGKGNLVASLTGQGSVPRIIRLPRMNRRLLKEAIPREMKREFPVPLDEMHLSWQVIDGEDGHLRIFALGVPRDTLDPLVRAITVAGGRPRSADIKPLALVRAIARREALIADLEPQSLDVIVVLAGVPATIRTISLPQEIETTEEKVRRLGEELARAVKFYNDTHQEKPLQPSMPVFLTGSLADSAASSGVVEASIGHAVEPPAPPLECPSDLPVATFMVNIGLALKER